MKMIRMAFAMTLGLMVAACGVEAPGRAAVDEEAAFLARCLEETLRVQSGAASWVDKHCDVQWQRATAASFMADAILAVARDPGGAERSHEDARSRLTGVQWTSETEGTLGDLAVHLADSDRLSFSWYRTGAEVPYNVIDALRLRGVALRSLGCPQYPGASMGREKVMAAEASDRAPFILTVYSRFAPTGIEPGLYEVDADFSTALPDLAALRAGLYPGGGGRAFAIEATDWVTDCPDPD
jgi:hypothetical protein